MLHKSVSGRTVHQHVRLFKVVLPTSNILRKTVGAFYKQALKNAILRSIAFGFVTLLSRMAACERKPPAWVLFLTKPISYYKVCDGGFWE